MIRSIHALFFLSFALLISCVGRPETYHWQGNTISDGEITLIKESLDKNAEADDGEMSSFREYYGLDFVPEDNWSAHRLSKEDYPFGIFIHTLVHPEALGMVMVLHGYLDHGALNSRTAEFLYQSGYSVTLVDLPGHGFSTGSLANIQHFDQYGEMVSMVLDHLTEQTDLPLFLIGHSTGGASIINYILTKNSHPLSGVVLVAPLIETQAMILAEGGVFLVGWFLERVPTALGFSTSNPMHADLTGNHDILRISSLPLQWVRATIQWKEYIAQSPEGPTIPILLLQGTSDFVVNPDHNIPEITRIFPQAQLQWIEDGYHSLLNEPEEKGQAVYTYLGEFLENGQVSSAQGEGDFQ